MAIMTWCIAPAEGNPFFTKPGSTGVPSGRLFVRVYAWFPYEFVPFQIVACSSCSTAFHMLSSVLSQSHQTRRRVHGIHILLYLSKILIIAGVPPSQNGLILASLSVLDLAIQHLPNFPFAVTLHTLDKIEIVALADDLNGTAAPTTLNFMKLHDDIPLWLCLAVLTHEFPITFRQTNP